MQGESAGRCGRHGWWVSLGYRIAFWVTLTILVAIVGSGMWLFDRTIATYLDGPPLPFVNGTGERYVFLDPAWYEGIDLLPASYENNVRTAADFEAWKPEFVKTHLRAHLHSPDTVVVTSSAGRDGHTLNRLL